MSPLSLRIAVSVSAVLSFCSIAFSQSPPDRDLTKPVEQIDPLDILLSPSDYLSRVAEFPCVIARAKADSSVCVVRSASGIAGYIALWTGSLPVDLRKSLLQRCAAPVAQKDCGAVVVATIWRREKDWTLAIGHELRWSPIAE